MLSKPFHALAYVVLVDMGLVTIMAVMMNTMHWGLVAQNLTTNEYMNKRYPYLRNEKGEYENAFNFGVCGNVSDFWGRGARSAADPYLYSKMFAEMQRTKFGGPKEMKAVGASKDAVGLLADGGTTDGDTDGEDESAV